MAHKLSAMDLATCLTDPNILLSKALANRNIEDFRVALELGAHPLANGDDFNIFAIALSTYGCVEFVEECFKAGCSPHKVIDFDENKCPINFAAESQDPAIISAVLSYKEVNVNNKQSFIESTPMNTLAAALNDENIDNIFKCMQILLKFGASPNIGNVVGCTPLNYILYFEEIDKLKKLQILQLLLSQPDLDIDTFCSGELRGILAEDYPDLKLPVKHESHPITYHILSTYIRMGDMDKFQQQFSDTQRNTTDQENELLLRESIQTGSHLAFDLLIESGVNYNRITLNNNLVLFDAYYYGNWYVLEKLLQQPDIRFGYHEFPLFVVIYKLSTPCTNEFCDHWKCFNILLKSNKIDINRVDDDRNTALHLAVKYRNNEAVKKLLKKGADISIKNIFNDLPIDGLNPEVLEEHFDKCISSNSLKSGEHDYKILINFRNLRPEKKLNQRFREDMTPMIYMAKNKEFHRILLHPVMTSYLFLKWQKLSLVFYINFILYIFYAISVMTHVVLKFRLTDHTTSLAVTEIMTWLGICYLTIRETIQFIMCPKRYVSSFTNYMEVALIILSVITCIEHHFVSDIQRQIAVVTILLAAVEISQLVGSLPVTSISTHILMLEAVCKSFLKSFLFYSIFVITFALCFYIMSDYIPLTDEKAFNQFATPMVAFSKTIVMLTGEFDASDFKLDYFHLLIFLIFIFVVPIIMMNLLNGLAVNDTQEIKAQAELNFIICRINLLTRYEQLFIERVKQTKSIFNRQAFHALSKCWAYLFPDYTYSNGSQISILPNQKNTILLAEKKTERNNARQESTDSSSSVNISLTTEHEEIKRQNLLRGCFFCIFRKYAKIDYRTVQLAKTILERKKAKKSETDFENRFEQKLDKISKSMSEFMQNRFEQKLDEILERKSETNVNNGLEQKLDELLKLMSEQVLKQ